MHAWFTSSTAEITIPNGKTQEQRAEIDAYTHTLCLAEPPSEQLWPPHGEPIVPKRKARPNQHTRARAHTQRHTKTAWGLPLAAVEHHQYFMYEGQR